MFCTKCGFEIKDGYKFCPKCGTPAYIEKEEPKGEVKEEVDVVTKDANVSVASEPVVKSTENVKKTAKENTASKPKKNETDSRSKSNYIPNPLIANELDIEGVKKKAEQGDEGAMFRQAFRYGMGIGVEKDVEKSKEIYDKLGGNIGDSQSWISGYFISNIFPKNLCVISNN